MVGAKENLKLDSISTDPKTLDNLVENENPHRSMIKISKTHGDYDRLIVGYALAKASLDSAEEKGYWSGSIKSRLDEMRRFTENLEEVYKAKDYREVLEAWESQIRLRLSAIEETLKAYGRKRIASEISELLCDSDIKEMLTKVGSEVIKAIRGMKTEEGRIHRPYRQRNSVTLSYVPPTELKKNLLRQEEIVRKRLGKRLDYILQK